MTSGAAYVVAAHGVIAAALVLYVAVAAMRSARQGRETEVLRRLVERGAPDAAGAHGERPAAISGRRR